MANSRTSTAHARSSTRSDLVRTYLGYACNQAFMFALFYMGWNSAVTVGGMEFERIDLLITLLAAAGSFTVLRLVTRRVRDVVLNRSMMWCYAVLLAIGSSVSLPAAYGLASIVIEGLLVGVPFACLLAAWGRALGKRSHGETVRGVLLATAVAAVLTFFVYLLCMLNPLCMVIADVFPFMSAWALVGLEPLRSNEESADKPPSDAQGRDGEAAGDALAFGNLIASKDQRSETLRISRKVVGGTLLFGLAGGLMETYASDPGMAATPTFAATLLLLALFCAGSLQVVGTPRKPFAAAGDDAGLLLVGVYRLSLLLMMAGYLFVPVLEPFGVPGDAIVLAGYLGLSAILVSLFVLTAKLTGIDAALSFSRGFAVLYIGEACGLGLGNVLELASPSGDMPFAVASCAGLATLFAYLFLFTEGDFIELSRIAKQADRFGDACRIICSRFKLSKRESEILPLALRGRTGERMAAELFIAKSTVDTHLRRIYAKCGVHSRQELIDLGESAARDELIGKE